MQTLIESSLPAPFAKLHTGKVRDSYEYDGKRIILTTDRQSAFDINVGAVPFKGQVLNSMSTWWFKNLPANIPSHYIAQPDPNIMIVKKAKMFPVEVVVRGYLTGSTDTSAWVNYNKGVRNFCGNILPEGMKKNEAFSSPIITPTTKPEIGHDMPISAEEILEQGLVDAASWKKIEEYALALYNFGVETAKKRGLIFVDTKYEFGLDENGNVIVCDEVNTPDSSRYWIESSYEERLSRGEEPQSLDKEFLRLYLKDNGYTEENIHTIPASVFTDLSKKYIELYEKVTGEHLTLPESSDNILERINKNLRSYFRIDN